MPDAVRIVTNQGDGKRVYTTNSTSAAFASPADTTTAPSADGTDGYISCTTGSDTHNIAVVTFVGTDAADEQFEAECYGVWARQDGATTRYFHSPLWRLDVTLGALITGETDEYHADTITISSDLSDVTVRNASGTADYADRIARVSFDIQAAQWLYFDFDIDALTTDAASANAIYWFI